MVVIQESERMIITTTGMKRSLAELDLGLCVDPTMSEPMERAAHESARRRPSGVALRTRTCRAGSPPFHVLESN
jgi:hypothetical protein